MKFTALLISACLQVSAGGLAQTVSLSEKNATLKEIFKQIHRQTGYEFLYSSSILENAHPVDIVVKDTPLKEALEICFRDQPLTYIISEKTIVVQRLEPKETIIHEEPAAESITGTVRDNEGNPMPGVNVILKGTTIGTSTDADGRYVIDAGSDGVLVYSFIGFKTLEVEVHGRSVIDITMEIDATTLKEVIVNAGYYDVKQKEKTGNISSITAEEIQKQPTSNPLQAMQGRMPGVYISQYSGIPGGNFSVQVRGINSIENGNNPLYIIDGVPFISESLSHINTAGTLYGGLGTSPLYNLNPNDIERIDVLKDADATAIYGSRGANGVVLITTKKGKTGKAKFDINVYSGASKVPRKLDLLNTQQYIAMRKKAFENDGETMTIHNAADMLRWDTTRYTDWQEVLIGGTAQMTNVQASVSGGSDQTQFLFTGNYQKHNTVFPGNNSSRKTSSHFSIVHESPNEKFNVRASTDYTLSSSNMLNFDITATAVSLAPNAPQLYDSSGRLNWENSTWTNPLANLERRFESDSYNLVSNAVLGYKITQGLTIRSSIGINDIRSQERSITPSTFYNPALGRTPENSLLFHNYGSSRSWIIEPQLNWETKIDDDARLSFIAGTTFQEQLKENQLQQLSGFPSNALINDFNSASTVNVLGYNKIKYRYNAIYGRANFNWKEKYIINLTGRRDGSSRFGPGKQFANFGAIGVAWMFSLEDLIKNDLKFISLGKLRASYGVTGNDQIGDYEYLNTYASSGSYQGIVGLTPNRLYNPDFGWEVSKKMEIAMDLGFLDDDVLLSVGYYRNRSSDQLVDYKLAATTGFSSVLKNFLAIVENSGIEFDLTTQNVNRGSLKWVTSFNVTIPRNRLIAFPNIESSSYRDDYVVGKSLSLRKLYNYIGVDLETGVYQFEDMNHDGFITSADRMAEVEVLQDYYGGLNNAFTFKGLQLDLFLQFISQNGLNYHSAFTGAPGRIGNQPTLAITEAWKNPGDKANVQVLTSGSNSAITSAYSRFSASNAAYVDASFIRVRNISLSYNFPAEWLRGMKVRTYLQGQNLFTITRYRGLDPETTSSSRMPPLRTFTAGIQLTL